MCTLSKGRQVFVFTRDKMTTCGKDEKTLQGADCMITCKKKGILDPLRGEKTWMISV